MKKKVFVSGCFDLLHSGHVRFLEEAATYGAVHVALGADQNIRELKGRAPVNSEAERRYLLEALRHVTSCSVNRGSGVLDFVEDLKAMSPDFFIVNEDGHTPAKAALCRRFGIKYVVLKRTPKEDLPARSTTDLRKVCRIPYRLDLAGGWLDQPYVSRHAAGPVLTISLEPNVEFNERSGMASSSRRRAIELWETTVPAGDLEKLARMLFAFENPPGTEQFSGSQDAIGIVFPGLNRLDYAGDYWPRKITSVHDEKVLRWLEEHLRLVSLGPRKPTFNVLRRSQVTPTKARALAVTATGAWETILKRDLKAFGRFCRASFEAQIKMFPDMVDAEVRAVLKNYQHKAAGWKLSGAGGGGYLVLVTNQEIPNSTRLTIRRRGL